MEPVIAALALFVFGGLTTYTIAERRHRIRWARHAQRPVAESHSPFRHPAGPPSTRAVLIPDRAPKLIRRTALWSIYMGQMALPGGALGLFGVFFGAGLGLLSIPGMILAVRIWRLGYAMLRREPGAAAEARKLTQFALILNFFAVGISLVLVLIAESIVVLFLVVGAYAIVSVAHAHAMWRCAELLEQTAAKDFVTTSVDTAAAPMQL